MAGSWGECTFLKGSSYENAKTIGPQSRNKKVGPPPSPSWGQKWKTHAGWLLLIAAATATLGHNTCAKLLSTSEVDHRQWYRRVRMFVSRMLRVLPTAVRIWCFSHTHAASGTKRSVLSRCDSLTTLSIIIDSIMRYTLAQRNALTTFYYCLRVPVYCGRMSMSCASSGRFVRRHTFWYSGVAFLEHIHFISHDMILLYRQRYHHRRTHETPNLHTRTGRL